MWQTDPEWAEPQAKGGQVEELAARVKCKATGGEKQK